MESQDWIGFAICSNDNGNAGLENFPGDKELVDRMRRRECSSGELRQYNDAEILSANLSPSLDNEFGIDFVHVVRWIDEDEMVSSSDNSLDEKWLAQLVNEWHRVIKG
mmetsp:Transcript_27338/g.33522  ORF Transcript_27338/g.33522 Transcript_27338/m.33522 type:complete len:108 (+) Transcript_27338:376-699(+)